MADSTDQGDNTENKSGKVDLTDLQNFNFAANWSESPAAPARGADRDRPGRRDSRPDRRPPKRRFSGEEPARPEGGGRPGPRDDRHDRRGERGRSDRRQERPAQPLWRESPFDVQIYPDDPILTTLTRAMRHSLRTYELFEIARLVLEKPERFHVSIRYKENAGEGDARLLFQSVPDGLPFTTEEGAVDHVLRNHLGNFFTTEQVEVEPPKGTFQFIARCSITGDFLSPPNFHRYQSILLQYHQERFPDMPFERFRGSIETVKDEEAVQKWLQTMTTVTRYKVAGEESGETFDSLDQARSYLLRQSKDSVVRSVKVVKLSGKKAEEIVDPAMKPYIDSAVEHQKRFPLDTANGLRGRLRRQDFFIYKRGSRGISYVCAVKRKFRQEGQVFADSVEGLLKFVEENDMIHASELAEKFLHITPPAEGAPVDPANEEKIKRMTIDLRWLLSEGYVSEFSDGRLQAHPATPAAKPHEAGASAEAEPEPEEAQELSEGAQPVSPEGEPEAGVPPEPEARSEEGSSASEEIPEEQKAAPGEPEPPAENVSEVNSTDAPAPAEDARQTEKAEEEETSVTPEGSRNSNA